MWDGWVKEWSDGLAEVEDRVDQGWGCSAGTPRAWVERDRREDLRER